MFILFLNTVYTRNSWNWKNNRYPLKIQCKLNASIFQKIVIIYPRKTFKLWTCTKRYNKLNWSQVNRCISNVSLFSCTYSKSIIRSDALLSGVVGIASKWILLLLTTLFRWRVTECRATDNKCLVCKDP